MLSRSNSTAGERLRRAKSTSSHHTTSSGHLRTSTSIDPFVSRQQAEVAAAEAYNRARQNDEPSCRPVPPKLQRRRSQTAGRTEGSHFEDARFGRRGSASSRGDGRTAQPTRSKPLTVSEAVSESSGGEKVITRKRSVIPPSASNRQSQHEYLSVPTTNHRMRKRQSAYADGSPTPRHASTLQEHRSSLQLSSTPTRGHTNGYGGNLATLSDFGEPQDIMIQSFTSQRPSIRETQTDEEILALARDRCLQDFQQKKVRERKSMFLAPFQKRRSTNTQKSSEASYDTCPIPYNYADDATMAPLPPAPDPIPTSQIPILRVEKKSRNFSDTIKGRIKKALRKASRAPTGLPAQQIDAKHFHYSASEEAYHSLSDKNADPFVTITAETLAAPLGNKSASVNSRASVGQTSNTTSRVTSWTNSTVAGTCASRADNGHMPAASEHGGLKRSNSQSTLGKASSLFGRPVMNKSRKPSRAQLDSSEESQSLYTALQDRLRPSRRTPTPTPSQSTNQEQAPRPRVPSAIDSLPSQQQPHATSSTMSRHSVPTVRSVIPDPMAYKLGICSPVAEVLCPDAATPVAVEYVDRENESAEATPSAHLHRRAATKAPAPTQEQLARRVEKSRNRWQSPLDELSPAAPRSTRATMMEDNPYELRSLSQSHQQPPVINDLPHHARIALRDPVNRTNMLSPSVYSRATDGASPRPDTPVQPIGTVVTITGREVRSYSISPPKKVEEEPLRPAQTSGQWRRWLSDEMGSFKAGLENFTLTQALVHEPQPTSVSLPKSVGVPQNTTVHQVHARPTSTSPLFDVRPASAVTSTRPRASSRRSSFMNERYPMIDDSRNSSSRSIQSRNASRTGERTASSSEQSSQAAVTRPSVDAQPNKSSFTRQRVITGRHSVARPESAARSKSALGSRDTKQAVTMSGALTGARDEPAASDKAALPSERRARTSTRHKSAFELRANYKNSNTGRSTPLEIRRKPMNDATDNMLEDTTIRDISAGPYASDQPLPTTSTHRDNNIENTPPHDTSSLPALSSSEWLSAGTNKARRPSAVHPAYRNRSVSRLSPVKTGQHVGLKDVKASPASPGQRLAGEWLEKRSRENTPAFV